MEQAGGRFGMLVHVAVREVTVHGLNMENGAKSKTNCQENTHESFVIWPISSRSSRCASSNGIVLHV